MVEGKVRTVSAHSVWWRARYVQLVHTRCGGGQGTYSMCTLGVVEGKVRVVSALSVWWKTRYV